MNTLFQKQVYHPTKHQHGDAAVIFRVSLMHQCNTSIVAYMAKVNITAPAGVMNTVPTKAECTQTSLRFFLLAPMVPICGVRVYEWY